MLIGVDPSLYYELQDLYYRGYITPDGPGMDGGALSREDLYEDDDLDDLPPL